LGVVSKAVPRRTAQATSTCAGVWPTRPAIAKMTGSSGARVLFRDPIVMPIRSHPPENCNAKAVANVVKSRALMECLQATARGQSRPADTIGRSRLDPRDAPQPGRNAS
jgi:hypothetical protein